MTEEVTRVAVWRGALVLMAGRKLSDGERGKCFECGADNWTHAHGWFECRDCGFRVSDGS